MPKSFFNMMVEKDANLQRKIVALQESDYDLSSSGQFDKNKAPSESSSMQGEERTLKSRM